MSKDNEKAEPVYLVTHSQAEKVIDAIGAIPMAKNVHIAIEKAIWAMLIKESENG